MPAPRHLLCRISNVLSTIPAFVIAPHCFRLYSCDADADTNGDCSAWLTAGTSAPTSAPTAAPASPPTSAPIPAPTSASCDYTCGGCENCNECWHNLRVHVIGFLMLTSSAEQTAVAAPVRQQPPSQWQLLSSRSFSSSGLAV